VDEKEGGEEEETEEEGRQTTVAASCSLSLLRSDEIDANAASTADETCDASGSPLSSPLGASGDDARLSNAARECATSRQSVGGGSEGSRRRPRAEAEVGGSMPRLRARRATAAASSSLILCLCVSKRETEEKRFFFVHQPKAGNALLR